MQRLLFHLYSWVTNLGWSLLDLLPQCLRGVVFRLLLEEYGNGGVTIDYHTYIRYPSKVSIGAGTTVNRGCRFYASHHHPDVRIRIGAHVAVAPEVSFFAAGHDYTQLSLPDTAASITVGDHAWIGARSVVLQGVTIGEGAVVAAGSVVTRDIPPYTVAAGVPARVIKPRELNQQRKGETT